VRKRPLLIIVAAVIAIAIAVVWERRDYCERNFEGIEIRGASPFVAQVENSLRLLRDKSPDAFALTQRYMKRIDESRHSGMWAYDEPPTFDLAPKTAFYSISWCAGAIAHDMYHSKLYHEYIDAHGEPVPDDAWCGQSRELECNAFQLRVLKEIGAPGLETTYLAGLDGTHNDVNHDGKLNWLDSWLQHW
jgi:hypothetical protein